MGQKTQKILLVVLAILMLSFIVLGVAYSYKSRETLGKIAGTRVSKNEFIFLLKQVRTRLEESMLSNETTMEERRKFWDSEVEGKTASEAAEEIALDEAKKIKIQLIKANENKIELTKEEKDKNKKEIDEMVEKLGGTINANQRIFMVYGVPMGEYKKIREEISLVNKYMDSEKTKLKASDEELLDYYNKIYENEEQVTTRHILLSTVDSKEQPLPDDKIEEQRVKANELLERLKNGEDIEKLVRENTADVSSIDTKGQYTFRKGQMVSEFEGWAFNNAPGSMGVIKTEYGFHVIVKPTFEELKGEILDKVLNGKYEEMLNEWVKLPEYELVINQKALKSVRNIIEQS